METNDIFSDVIRENVNDMQANAIASTSDAQARSKERFDQGRPVVDYAIGDKVLARASDRAPKLANKYEGPFEVLSRDKDIYELKNLVSNKQE